MSTLFGNPIARPTYREAREHIESLLAKAKRERDVYTAAGREHDGPAIMDTWRQTALLSRVLEELPPVRRDA